MPRRPATAAVRPRARRRPSSVRMQTRRPRRRREEWGGPGVSFNTEATMAGGATGPFLNRRDLVSHRHSSNSDRALKLKSQARSTRSTCGSANTTWISTSRASTSRPIGRSISAATDTAGAGLAFLGMVILLLLCTLSRRILRLRTRTLRFHTLRRTRRAATVPG